MVLVRMRPNAQMPLSVKHWLTRSEGVRVGVYFKPTDNMIQEELHELTVDQYKELEAKRMERNAWRVSQDVVSRIDGEPGPAGDCI